MIEPTQRPRFVLLKVLWGKVRFAFSILSHQLIVIDSHWTVISTPKARGQFHLIFYEQLLHKTLWTFLGQKALRENAPKYSKSCHFGKVAILIECSKILLQNVGKKE